MDFANRIEETRRLDRLLTFDQGSLAVVTGRRRIGKTRLLLEWARARGGLYTVADQSSAEIQRVYFAEAVASRIPGFADVTYRDWRGLLDRLAREAQRVGWRGPLIFDELPYLVVASPELPSVLQRWLDHDAREAGLVVAIAGSSQRMMQGIVLDGDAPLYGRAREILILTPLDALYLHEIFPAADVRRRLELWTAWGGVPRYWELAAEIGGVIREQIDELVLDPLGPLHREPDRLLIEELPPAPETRPVLDAIGAGAHRLSEIAGRMGRPATSMSRPLGRLMEMGLVRRETPFGEPPKSSRRSLYRIDDPFVRLWFRVVAPHRAQLASGVRETRLAWLDRHWKHLCAAAWEELCRHHLARTSAAGAWDQAWGPAGRWWRGGAPEWDVVSASLDGTRVLCGEVKWSARPLRRDDIERLARRVLARTGPMLPGELGRREVVRALFVPELDGEIESAEGVRVIRADQIIGKMLPRGC